MSTVTKIRDLYVKYERRLSSFALLVGFTIDNFTLQRIDLHLENIILFSYILIAGVSITYTNFFQANILRGKFFGFFNSLSPLAIQFAFGGLFSGFLIFYSRSASLLTSWPFILFLAFLLIGNEYFKERYQRLTFQLSILFIAIFSYLIFLVPIVIHSMGAFIFVLSGLISILTITLVVKGLKIFIPSRIKESEKSIKTSLVLIFVTINALYFLNVIPPIPLSLKDSGVYQYVMRTEEGNYFVLEEDRTLLERILFKNTVHPRGNNSIYVYSAVFAPTDLDVSIVHNWQIYNEERKKWVTQSKIEFPIRGGRDGGYRGYTFMRTPTEGSWRVRVETKRGQILGVEKFNVEKNTSLPVLVEKTI